MDDGSWILMCPRVLRASLREAGYVLGNYKRNEWWDAILDEAIDPWTDGPSPRLTPLIHLLHLEDRQRYV